MRDRSWQIALFGTFDVQNYGDLLFPIIAEAELAERLGPVKLHRFSYHAKTQPDWPYTVTSVMELPKLAASLDGVLIGGGFLIRFDKEVAPAYGPSTPKIHHPTGYWLTPALIALQHGIPLVWNSPGMHCNEIPAWADPLMEMAFTLSTYIAVRDEPSRSALIRFAGKNRITLVPDTAFGISRLLNRRTSFEFDRLRDAAGLTDRYIIIQPSLVLDDFLRFARKHADRLRDYRFLVLPIGPVLGDQETTLGLEPPGLVRLPEWPHPLLLAELISKSSAVIGHSYHLAITALASGVPVFTPNDLSVGKYSALRAFETIFPLPKESEPDPERFIARLGKTAPSQAARAALDRLVEHWDRIAEVVRTGDTATQPDLNRFWQSLPILLETAADRYSAHVMASEEEGDKKQRRIDELSKLLALARTEIVARDERIAKIYDSHSMRVTSPLRFLMRGLKRLVGNGTRS